MHPRVKACSLVSDSSVKVILGETNQYRNVVPKDMIEQVKEQQQSMWEKKTDEELGQRHEMVQKAYDIKPRTKAEDY